MIRFTGIRSVDRKLSKLETKIGKKVARTAINGGLAFMSREIKKRTPKKSGVLKKSIGKRFKKGKQSKTQEAKVGINVGKKKSKPNSFAPHGHLVTLGTRRRRSKSGANRGRMRPNRFIRQGIRASRSQAKRVMKEKAIDKLEKETSAL